MSSVHSLNEALFAGYWISPSGTVVPVSQVHILTVIENPAKFSMSPEAIQAVFDKYGEKLGSEGNAREEIIVTLVKKGWIRIRNYGNRGWSVNVARVSDRVRDTLTVFFQTLKGIPDRYGDVKILSPTEILSYTVDDIVKYKLFNEYESRIQEIRGLKRILVWGSINDVPDFDH
jgi:hypothetical protein